MPSPNPGMFVRLYQNVQVSGYPVEGEVELNVRALHEDDIQEVHVKLRGVAKTFIEHDKTSYTQTEHLVRGNVSLWSRGSAYPPPGSDTLCVPFRMRLPPNLPPSFYYVGLEKRASVQYAITAVGVRSGAFQPNRRVHVPLAVVPPDPAGKAVRESLTLMASGGAQYTWRSAWKEEKIRRGLWGEYSTVQVQLLLPDISVLPLYVPIPFVLKIKSISAPLTRAKADALPPDKPAFPPVPSAFEMVQFKLHSEMFIKARTHTRRPSKDVAVFARSSSSMLDADVPPRQWVPLEPRPEKKQGEIGPDTKGTWIQEATFRSSFRLDCTPTFAIETIRCTYLLTLKVPFPGLGNNVRIDIPVTITSGIDAPLVRDSGPGGTVPGAPLNLPPTYWDAANYEWDDTKD